MDVDTFIFCLNDLVFCCSIAGKGGKGTKYTKLLPGVLETNTCTQTGLPTPPYQGQFATEVVTIRR